MSGIAEVLLNLGYKVSGSDISQSETTRRLNSMGAEVAYGHRPENINAATVVVISSAVKWDNPEVRAAREKHIPVIPRAEMLAELMRLKWGIAIAGTHGKTTTTSLVAQVLAHGGLDPTAIIGGKVNAFGSNAKLGEGRFLVAEADESDGSFLKLTPVISVVTNVDPEHMEYFKTEDALMEAFTDFIDAIPFYGLAVLCMDCDNLRKIMGKVEKRVVTYGTSHQADFRAENIKVEGLKSSFRVLHHGDELGEITIPTPGLHNVLNALASVVVGLEVEIPFDKIAKGLASYQGIGRRFQIKHSGDELMVVDDYAHHPTEIRVTLEAARGACPASRIIAVFQPHRYSRTRDLRHEFRDAFDNSDILILTDVYPAGEEPIPGISGEVLYRDIKDAGHKSVQYTPECSQIPALLHEIVKPGDLIMTLGAGDVYKAGEKFVGELKKK